jgi:predicted acetyltransferase
MSSTSKDFRFRDPGPLVDDDLMLILAAQHPGDQSTQFAPAYEFEMRHPATQERLGMVEFRVGATPELLNYDGQLAYSVEEPYRGRHYAARACRLLMPLIQSHGFSEVWITCNPDNWASRRTCELLGAEMVEIVPLPQDYDLYLAGEREKCRYRLMLE